MLSMVCSLNFLKNPAFPIRQIGLAQPRARYRAHWGPFLNMYNSSYDVFTCIPPFFYGSRKLVMGGCLG